MYSIAYSAKFTNNMAEIIFADEDSHTAIQQFFVSEKEFAMLRLMEIFCGICDGSCLPYMRAMTAYIFATTRQLAKFA